MPNPLQGMTFKRTVIVGLGSTGLDILHAFQDFWYERFNNTDTSLVKLINIETNTSNKPRTKPTGTMIDPVFIENDGKRYDALADALRTMVQPFEEEISYLPWDWRWTNDIHWSSLEALQDAGAGGIRAGGRLLLYSPDTNNRSNALALQQTVKATLRNDFRSIAATNEENAKAIFESLGQPRHLWVDNSRKHPPDNQGIIKSAENPHFESDRIKAIVVGSLAGGTSSGMFIDVGFILQNILGISENHLSRIYGMFVIPPFDQELRADREINWDLVRSNSFGAVYDILRMQSLCRQDPDARKPYGYVYLVAPEYNTKSSADRFKELSGLDEMVALRMFANVLGYQDEFDERITDQVLRDSSAYLFTMGAGAILYPKHALVEMAASELSENFCDTLLDEKYVTDAFGKKNRMHLNAMKESVKSRINEFADKYIRDGLRSTPDNFEKAYNKKLEEWHHKLLDDIHQNKKLLHHDFVDAKGYFMELMEFNKPKMVKDLLNKIEEELIQDLKQNINLVYVKEKITSYVLEFKRLKYLWELQGGHKYDSRSQITALVDEYLSYGKASAPTDHEKILKDLLNNLFERYLISNAYRYLDDVISQLDRWRKSLTKVTDDLADAKSEFHDRLKAFERRLKNDYEITPVIKLFHKSEEADYNHLKESLIGKRTTPVWEHFEHGGITPQSVWAELRLNRIETEEFKNTITKQLSKELREYLNKVNFDIFKSASQNEGVVSTVLSKIRSGFLKRESPELSGIDINPPHSVMANAQDKSQITDFIDEYRLGCSAVPNPMLEHMIFYTKDDLDLDFERFRSFGKMKREFLKDHPDQPDWTKLRLAYSSNVDFTIIEKTRHEEMLKLLRFVEYFWFNRISQPGGGRLYTLTTTPGIEYPQAELELTGSPRSAGVYVDRSGEPHFVMKHEVAGQTIDINLMRRETDLISHLCQEEELYNSLKRTVKSHLQFGEEDFIDNLYVHYQSLNQNGQSKDVYQQFKDIFSERFEPNRGIKIQDIQNQDCLIASVYNILSR